MVAKTKQRLPHQRGGVHPSAPARKGRHRAIGAKILMVFGALLMITSGTSAIAAKSIFDDLEANLRTTNVLGNAGKNTGGKPLSGAIDLLLLGIDTRGTDVRDSRADTIILVHVPASHDQAYLMSIPRDAAVDIPARGAYRGGRDRVNSAFAHGAVKANGWEGGIAGGLALQAETITNLTGIKFDGAAVIDFEGFKSIVDALGTVNMCVDGRTPSHHFYYVNGQVTYVNEKEAKKRGLKPFIHEKGCREMSGRMALDFSRQRYDLADGSSDYGRQRHQQQLLKAIAKKATSAGVLTDFGKIEELIKAVGNSMVIDTHGVDRIDFMLALKDLAATDLVLLKTNGGAFKTNTDNTERIDDGTRAMFQAAKDDRLGQFVLENPEFINREK